MRPDVYKEYLNTNVETNLPGKTGIKCFDHWTEELQKQDICTIMPVCGTQAFDLYPKKSVSTTFLETILLIGALPQILWLALGCRFTDKGKNICCKSR